MDTPKGIGTLKQIKERASSAFKREDNWRSLLEDCYDYCLPNRNLFGDEQDGQKKMDKVFDSTAVEAIQDGAGKIQDNIAPIWMKWAVIRPSAEVERMEGYEDFEQQIKEEQQKNTDIIFDYINRSNFHSQFFESCVDLLIGTNTLAIDETFKPDNPIVFSTIPQKGIAFSEGSDGVIHTHFRRHKLRARNIESTYVGFEASQQIREKIDKDPECEVLIHQGIIHDEKTDTYHGVVWVDEEDKISWYMDYKDSNPWNTSRYTKVAGEVRGRGPAVQLLADIKTLNKIKEFSLQKAAIDLSGIWMATDDGVTNPYNMTLSPGVVMTVGSNNSQNPSLMRLDTSTNLNLVLFEVQNLENRIKRAFFGDLRDPDSPVRSATEIALDSREMLKKMGSAFGRLQTELLIPIINRVAWILQRNGIIKPIKINGKLLTVQFTSPLAVAQDMQEMMAVQQAIEFTAATSGPEMVKVNFVIEDIGSWAGGKVGMPQELIRDKAEKTKAIEAGRAAAQQQLDGGQNVME